MNVDGIATRIRARAASDPALTAVLILSAIALVARLVFLGDRIAHFDEGRVAYWAVQFQETGTISYRYIVHGPFVQYVDAALFGLFGQNDAVARLPLAVFGGLLPLGALLFREHLSDVEVAGVAAFLALNPVLIYYSRFLRSTLLVAGFSFLAFGCLVRAVDTRQIKYVYAASALVALAFAAKENAVVYLIVWVGATAVVAAHHVLWPWTDASSRAIARRYWDRLIERVRAGGLPFVVSVASDAVLVATVFGLVTLFFFAPRNPASGVGFWYVLENPSSFPSLLQTTRADIVTGLEYWFGGASEPGCHKETLLAAYQCFLERFLGTLWAGAAPLALFAVGGFLIELSGRARPRSLVIFTSYWGFVSILGYPLGTDIYGAWITVNALVPLSVPAAVGLAWLLHSGRAALADDDRVSAGLVAVVLVLIVGQVGVTAAGTVYGSPAGSQNNLVQYAQPTDDYRPALDRVEALADEDDGADVVVYGDTLIGNGSPMAPDCADLAELLPTQWYLANHDLRTTCLETGDAEAVGDRRPLLVITRDADAELTEQLEGYERRENHFRTTEDHDTASGERTTFFVREDVAASGDLGGHRSVETSFRPD